MINVYSFRENFIPCWAPTPPRRIQRQRAGVAPDMPLCGIVMGTGGWNLIKSDAETPACRLAGVQHDKYKPTSFCPQDSGELGSESLIQ